jgi:hypothetical protein
VRRFPLVLLVLVVALAGCGSGTKTYTDSKTRLCLQGHGVQIESANNDIVASTSTGGAFRARFADNAVTVVFGATVNDANNINDAYHKFSGKNVGLDDVLRQQSNVVMLWHLHPLDADITAVTTCLK